MNDFVNPFLQYDEEGRQDFDLGYLLGQDVEPFIPVAPAPVAPAPAPVAAAPAPAASAFQLPAGWSTTYMGGVDVGGEYGGSAGIEEGTYAFTANDEALLRSLGFEGQFEASPGFDENLDLSPEAKAFLEQGGYRLAGKDIGGGRTLFSAVDASGKPVGATRVYDPRENENPWFNLASSVLTALAGNVMAGGLIAGGVPSVLAKSGMGYILSGGDEKAALGAGIGSLAAPYIGGAAKAVGEAVGGGTLGDIASKAVSGAGTSALGAAVRGGDIGEALVSGALSGGTGAAVNAATSGLLDQVDLPAPVERVAGSALTSALLGRDVEKAVTNSIIGEIMRAGSRPPEADSPLSRAYGPGSGWTQDTPTNQQIYREIYGDEGSAGDEPDLLGGFDLPPDTAPAEQVLVTGNRIPETDLVDRILAESVVQPMAVEELVRSLEPPSTAPAEQVTVTGNRGLQSMDEAALDAILRAPIYTPPDNLPTVTPPAEQVTVTGSRVSSSPALSVEDILQTPIDTGNVVSPDAIMPAPPAEKITVTGNRITPPPEGDTPIYATPVVREGPSPDEAQKVVVTAPRVTPTAIEPVLSVEDIINTPIDVGPPPDPEVIIGPPPVVTPPPRPAPAPAPAPAPSPAPAPAAKPKEIDWPLWLALLGQQQQRAPEEYRVAQITARNPFGTIFDQGEETSLEDLLRIMRG